METYQNTFEMFGDPSPRECESAEQYAESLLPFFEENGGYYVSRPAPETSHGSVLEYDWQRRVFKTAMAEFVSQGDEPEADDVEIPIDRQLLIKFLTEAVTRACL